MTKAPAAAQKNTTDISSFRTLKVLFSLLFSLDKKYFFIIVGNSLSGSALSILMIYIPRIFIQGYQAGWELPHFAVALLLICLVRYLLLQVREGLKKQANIRSELFNEKVTQEFASKVMRLDYAKLEDTEVLDLKERALFPIVSYGGIYALWEVFTDLLAALVTLLGVLTILLLFSYWFVLALLVLAVVNLVLLRQFTLVMQEVQQTIIPINRRYGYYVNIATNQDFQKEFRIYGMNEILERKIDYFTLEMSSWLKNIYVAQAKAESKVAVINGLTRFITYGYAAVRVLTSRLGPRIGLGQFTVIIGAAESFSTALMTGVKAVLQFIQYLHHLQPFARFMLLPEASQQEGDLQPSVHESLVFEHVTFVYPGTDKVILDDISFTINRGEKISIVGLNNAGKSTIVKLICRLFEPTEGKILWNGVDIRDYRYEAYLQQLSCVFQDFQLFPFSIFANIAPRWNESDQAARAKVQEILAEVELADKISELPQGIDTKLDKSLYEDATDLSVGQKQKVAIARAICKEASLVILDEPTAALDPLAESEIYEHFNQLTRERTTIFISHRMSSSVFCDRILLINEGKIAAFDSHDKLMQTDNLYRQLFETQAQHYRH